MHINPLIFRCLTILPLLPTHCVAMAAVTCLETSGATVTRESIINCGDTGSIHTSSQYRSASSSNQPDSVSAPAEVVLDELNVTALKQEDRLRTEALAATVIGRAELERLDAVTIKGISDVVPNFYIPDYGSRITSSVYVRGIGARMDQPAVGLTVDNVPVLNKDAYDFDVADIASVEMLRGPQSTLYGRNTMGGLISVTTLSPMRYQGWRFMAGGGTGPAFSASAGWYHKFSRKFGLAVTANGSHSAGFFRNLHNGQKTDKERSLAGRIKVEWHPKAGLSVQNVLSTSVLRQGGYPYEYVNTGEINYNDTCFYRRFTLSEGLTLRKVHDRFSATSITSVQYIDDNMTLDQDFLPASYFTLTQKKRETGVTEDILFRAPAGEGIYKWLCGLFGFYKRTSMQAPVTFKDTGIQSLIEAHRNEGNPYYPIRWNSRVFPLNSDFNITTYGLALYHQSELRLGTWKVTAGVRLDYERSMMDYHSTCDTGYTIYENPSGNPEGIDFDKLTPYRDVHIVIDDTGKLHRDYWVVMPKVGIVKTWDDDGNVNTYLNISRGYKTGGFNTQMFSDVLQQRLMNIMGLGSKYDVDDIVGYKPESSWNYEVGAHVELPDPSLGIDAALFYIDCRDQQLTMFPDGLTTGRIMTNAGRTRSFGGELSLRWNPAGGFSANASYGYTNARFIKFYDGIKDYAGKRLPYAPSNTLFVQGLYQFEFSGKRVRSLELDLNVRGTGDIMWNESNTLCQPMYFLLGAGVTLFGKDWSVALWGKNLTSTRYHTFYFMSMGNEFVQRGKPLTAGVTLRWNI